MMKIVLRVKWNKNWHYAKLCLLSFLSITLETVSGTFRRERGEPVIIKKRGEVWDITWKSRSKWEKAEGEPWINEQTRHIHGTEIEQNRDTDPTITNENPSTRLKINKTIIGWDWKWNIPKISNQNFEKKNIFFFPYKRPFMTCARL